MRCTSVPAPIAMINAVVPCSVGMLGSASFSTNTLITSRLLVSAASRIGVAPESTISVTVTVVRFP
jgi:hypothetical protein